MAAITPAARGPVQVAASTNAKSSYLPLAPGLNRIWVSSTDWSGSKTAALKYTPTTDDDHLGTVKQPDFTTAVEFTENDGCDLNGPGFVCIEVSSANTAPVNLFVNKCELI